MPCTPGGTTTPILGLCKPASGETGWTAAINGNWDLIDAQYPVSFAQLNGTHNLKVKPSDFASQGLWVNGTTIYTAQASGFYNLFSGTVNDGFLMSSAVPFYAFNAVISVAASPTVVTYEYWNGSAWTAFVPTASATWTALGYTQARWTTALVTGWAVGGTGTNVPAGNYNIRVRQTTGTTTVTGRASSADQMDVTIDEVIVSDGIGNKFRYVSVVPVVTIETQGVNGRDQAGAFSANSFIYLWGTGGGGTFHALFSASSTAPTLQGGDTAKVLLGGYRTDANSLLLPWYQSGKGVRYVTGIADLVGGTASTATVLTLTVPPTAIHVWLQISNSGSQTISIGPEPFVLGFGSSFFRDGLGTADLGAIAVPLKISQTIYYGTASGLAVSIDTFGYEMPGNLN